MWDANGTSRTRPTLVWAWPEARSLHIASMATGSIPYSFRNLPLGSLTCLGPIPVHGTTLVLGPMRQTSIYISAWIYLSRIWTRDLSITLIDQRPYSHGHSTLIPCIYIHEISYLGAFVTLIRFLESILKYKMERNDIITWPKNWRPFRKSEKNPCPPPLEGWG